MDILQEFANKYVMIYIRTNSKTIWQCSHEFHVLTYAEEGFAPLNQHTKDSGVTRDQLVAFADLVNGLNEPGSLYPQAAVSALPRRLIRDQTDAVELCNSIEKFYRINTEIIRATKVLIDFRTPNIKPFVRIAIERSFRFSDAEFIEELVMLDDSVK